MLLLVMCLANAGCVSAQLVGSNRDGNRKILTFKYLNEGADMVIRARRNDAISTAKEKCSGRVRVLDENAQTENQGYTSIGNNANSAYALNSSYSFIRFECMETGPKDEIY